MNLTRTNNRFSRTRTGGGCADGSGGGDRGRRFGSSAASPARRLPRASRSSSRHR
ncbi:hypothetical protein [Streptomyces sp. LN590]|uniref:hypothetical protein n=1 Tax=unclassified Streptomyces TaxID=2593676 RepID=UPI0037102E0B